MVTDCPPMTAGAETTARNPHSGMPFDDGDAAIEAALEDVSIPALMCSMVHITGDPSWIRGDARPQGSMLNEYQGYMPEAMKAEVRRRAAPAISAYRDAGCVLPAPPSPAAVARDDGVPRVPAGPRRRRRDVPRGSPSRRVRCRRDHVGRRDPRRGEGRRARGGNRVRRGRAPRRDPPFASGDPVHDRREERRAGRHVVGQPLPGCTSRHRQPLLLLLVRACRPLDGVLLAAARARGVLRPGDAQVRHRGALPVRHGGDVRDVRRADEPMVGRGTHRRTASTASMRSR